ncbi:MAG: sigma-54-dependent Fis family transcriptional regulator [Deltaproteobacteria bacterium]|nr:sigma-54-dependent Fis family transcriptional regulator [Deltaproteobacteria bacterium]
MKPALPKPAIRVLIVDDDPTNHYLIKRFCEREQHLELRFVGHGHEAAELIRHGRADIVITDVRMPGFSGDELLSLVKREFAEIPVIIMTGYGSIEGAVEYLQRGADDYLTKPLSKEVFLHRLGRVVERVALTKEVERLRGGLESHPTDRLIGRSPKMVDLKRQLPTIAQTEASVVIYGDSGTGKELVARALHDLSRRASAPFVAVNCGALPETLLESELFGHRRGAFTDARSDVHGLVDAADTGTLFLDEIGEVPLTVQVKLLRFLESKEYKALGAPQTKIADVRIVAATNRDLRRAVDQRLFREDLYYRLNIVPLVLPSLRDRPDDVDLLASHFLERVNRKLGKQVRFSADALRALTQHPWPGNVRELENKIEQLVVMSNGPWIRPEDLALGQTVLSSAAITGEVGVEPYAAAKRKMLDDFERRYVVRLLALENGHITNAARRAGLDRKNLWQLLKRHNVNAAEYRHSATT